MMTYTSGLDMITQRYRRDSIESYEWNVSALCGTLAGADIQDVNL